MPRNKGQVSVMRANWFTNRAATLLAGLQTASASSVTDRSLPAAWKNGKQRTLSTFPHRRLLRRADSYLSRRATLTISLVQIAGQARLGPSESIGESRVRPR